MKINILLFALIFSTLTLSLSAKPVVDSVGVKNVDGKKVILYKVKAKDTYYSIGHKYNVTPEVIMKFNGSKKATLTIGNIVKVPTGETFKKSGKKSTEKSEEPEKKKSKKSEEPSHKETKKEKKARLAREEREEKEERAAKRRKARKEAAEEEKPAPIGLKPNPPTVQQVAVPPTEQQVNNGPVTQYKISAGETLYSIAKRFNTTVDEISKLNNFTSDVLTPGTFISVRPNSMPTPAPVATKSNVEMVKRDSTAVASVVVAPVGKDSSNAEHTEHKTRYGLYEKDEKGVATWIDDPSLDANKKLVLHRTAPIGTVIKITNPMTNRTTFAKVVGRFTDNEQTKDVLIVLTKNVADSLGALDKRFHVTISYGSPNE